MKDKKLEFFKKLKSLCEEYEVHSLDTSNNFTVTFLEDKVEYKVVYKSRPPSLNADKKGGSMFVDVRDINRVRF